MGVASSIGALGFWLFLAVVVGGGMWFDARKKESEQETLRRLVESGQRIDPALVDKMLRTTGHDRKDRDLKVGGIITLFAGFGLVILGWFLGKLDPQIFGVMLGVSGLVATIGIGLLLAGAYFARTSRDDQA
jgi:hypothetical protein